MPNRNALLEVLADEFSSQAQKDQAQAGLYMLDNPERVVVQEVATAEPTAVAPAKTGEWWEGKGMLGRDDYYRKMREAEPLNPEWSPEAQYAFERATFPATYEKIARDAEIASKLSAAEDADKNARREHLFVQHPSWRIRKEKWDYDWCALQHALCETNVKWRLVEGVPTKFKNDKIVPITSMPSAAEIAGSIASAVAASGGKVVDGTCRKSV
jgi:hypothetical protein